MIICEQCVTTRSYKPLAVVNYDVSWAMYSLFSIGVCSFVLCAL